MDWQQFIDFFRWLDKRDDSAYIIINEQTDTISLECDILKEEWEEFVRERKDLPVLDNN